MTLEIHVFEGPDVPKSTNAIKMAKMILLNNAKA
jgi:hypothetical protein